MKISNIIIIIMKDLHMDTAQTSFVIIKIIDIAIELCTTYFVVVIHSGVTWNS